MALNPFFDENRGGFSVPRPPLAKFNGDGGGGLGVGGSLSSIPGGLNRTPDAVAEAVRSFQNASLPANPGNAGAGAGGAGSGWSPSSMTSGGGGSSSSSGFFGGVDPGTPLSMDDQGMNDLLAGKLKGMLDAPSRFTPEVIAAMKGGLLSSSKGQAASAKENAKADAISRGQFRSGALGSNLAAIDRGQAASYTSGSRDIMLQKVNADQTDKLAALDRATGWLQNLRQYTLNADMNDIQRRQLQAQLALGFAQIDAQKSALLQNNEMTWRLANLNREPREGIDFIMIQSPGEAPPGHRVFLAALNQANQYLGGLGQ